MRRGALVMGALAASLAAILAVAFGGEPRAAGPPGIHSQIVSISIGDVKAVEGTAAAMRISMSGVQRHDVEVYWDTSDGTAVAGVDYAAGQHGVAVIPSGKTSTTCSLSSVNDTIHEPDRSFNVHI